MTATPNTTPQAEDQHFQHIGRQIATWFHTSGDDLNGGDLVEAIGELLRLHKITEGSRDWKKFAQASGLGVWAESEEDEEWGL